MNKHFLYHRKLAWFGLGLIVIVRLGILLMAETRDAGAHVPTASKSDAVEHDAATQKTIVDLQQYRQTSSNKIQSDTGNQGMATLLNLNPTINAWYLLEVDWQDGSKSSSHLENPQPRSQKLSLDPKYPSGIDILEGKAHHPCNLFGGASMPLDEAKKSHAPYASLCDGRIFLRNPVKGHSTRLEAEAEFVRKGVDTSRSGSEWRCCS